jgi:GNAT superfamily N-acetyltransferase
MQPMNLRPITNDDLDFLYRVYASTRLEELALTDWNDDQKTAFLHQQFTAQHQYYQANYTTAQFQIVEVRSEPIGRLYVVHWRDQIRIVDIALLPERRGKGVGTQLLGRIMDEARQLRLPVTIHVERFNPALHLYERLGFRVEADKGVYLFLKWTP